MNYYTGNIRRTKRDSDKYGNAMLITTVLSGGFPFALTVVALYMGYDTTDYILHFVLTNPMYWDIKTVYCTLILRAVLLFLVGIEFSRSGSYFLCCLFIVGDQLSKVFNCLKDIKFPIFVYLYTMFRILHGRIRNWLKWFLYLLVDSFFWGTVISSYFIIVCWKKVTLVIYLGAVIGIWVCILAQVTLWPNVVETFVLNTKVVEIQKTKTRTTLAKYKRKVNLRNVKIAMGIQPVKFTCGSFKIIDWEFLCEHFELLSIRIFDAILIS